MAGEWAKRRPSRRAITRGEAFETLQNIERDERYRVASQRAKRALTTFVLNFMDGNGCGWPFMETWAGKCGFSVPTLERAVRDLEAARLMTSQKCLYKRPGQKLRQGASNRWIDPRLLAMGSITSDGTRDAGSGIPAEFASFARTLRGVPPTPLQLQRWWRSAQATHEGFVALARQVKGAAVPRDQVASMDRKLKNGEHLRLQSERLEATRRSAHGR